TKSASQDREEDRGRCDPGQQPERGPTGDPLLGESSEGAAVPLDVRPGVFSPRADSSESPFSTRRSTALRCTPSRRAAALLLPSQSAIASAMSASWIAASLFSTGSRRIARTIGSRLVTGFSVSVFDARNGRT